MNRCAVFRSVRLQLRRLATALAVVATFALLLDGALGANHHLSAAAPGHHHAESHNHGSHNHGAHSHGSHGHDVDLSGVNSNLDVTAADEDGAPASAIDADANCWLNACYAAVVLPCPSLHALPVVFCGTVTAAHPRQTKGVVPDGLRKPPRPLALT
jgi:hypothetical protein